MIRPIELRDVPSPRLNQIRYERLPSWYLEVLRGTSMKAIIIGDYLIQVLIAALLNNPGSVSSVWFARNLALSEVLSIPTVMNLASVFSTVWTVMSEDQTGIQVSGLRNDVERCYDEASRDGMVDNSIRTMLKKTCGDQQQLKGRAFQYVCDDSSDINLTKMTFQHKFFLYLTSQCRITSDVVGIPLLGWTLPEIEQNVYFRHLSHLFRDVVIVGQGASWKSTHLVVSNPVVESGVE